MVMFLSPGKREGALPLLQVRLDLTHNGRRNALTHSFLDKRKKEEGGFSRRRGRLCVRTEGKGKENRIVSQKQQRKEGGVTALSPLRNMKRLYNER